MGLQINHGLQGRYQRKGKLKGLRSIRLTRGYRAYYRIEKDRVEFAFVERVDKHEY